MTDKILLLVIAIGVGWQGFDMMQQPEYAQGILGLLLFVTSIVGAFFIVFGRK